MAQVTRGAGDVDGVQHTFLLRHHRYPQMYVHPLVCSASSGAKVCARQDFSGIPDSTMLVFRHMATGFVDFAKIGFESAPEPIAGSVHRPRCAQCTPYTAEMPRHGARAAGSSSIRTSPPTAARAPTTHSAASRSSCARRPST